MTKIVCLALLAGGIVLIVVGVSATNSFGPDLSRFFTVAPADVPVWMLGGGIVAAVVGLATLLLSPKPT